MRLLEWHCSYIVSTEVTSIRIQPDESAGRDFSAQLPSLPGGAREWPGVSMRETGAVGRTGRLRGGPAVFLWALLLTGAAGVAQSTQPAPPQAAAPAAATLSTGDDTVARTLNQKIMESDALRPLDLGVYVHNGEATLTGTVPDAQTEQDVLDLARGTTGVTSVDDKLHIGKPSTTAPGFSATQPANAPAVSVAQASAPAPGNRRVPAVPVANDQPPDVMLTVPIRTPLSVMMQTRIDSKHTQPGTPFRGVIVHNIYYRRGIIAVPRGSIVDGTVIDARPSGTLKGSPQLALQLSNIYIGNRSYVLTSTIWAQKGPGKGPATAATVGGAAAFGALTGAIVGGGPVALLGAVLGGLGGAGLSAISPGARIIIPAESIVTFHLTGPLTVREPTMQEVEAISANAPPAYPQRRYRRNSPPPMPGAPPGGYPY